MVKNRAALDSQATKPSAAHGELSWSLLLGLICLLVLFHGLGSAELFEPDEGRNAEKAREILVLGDWVTPYQNFLPTLDKPMLLYWLIALSFKVFGIAEWSARLPSALSALACLLLVYRFAKIEWGLWEALWSVLVLATSVEFFMLSRIVIFDMSLMLLVTWALLSFYAAQKAPASSSSRLHWLMMYVAMGAATLLKGLVGVILPGMVIFFYLLLSRKWFLLSRMRLATGALVYLAIIAPWYAWVEIRNPGYLRYFFWEEHFVRYLTPHFSRMHQWFYFFGVLAVGFLPWSIILPATAARLWKRRHDALDLFLVVWAVVPFIFFSASHSKLPHYILPIFPALGLLTGRAAALPDADFTANRSRWIFIPMLFPLCFVLYLLTGAARPDWLAVEIRESVVQNAAVIGVYAAVFLLIVAVFAAGYMKRRWKDAGPVFLCTAVSLALFYVLLTQIVAVTSFHRSSKALARQLSSVLKPDDRLVFYNLYAEGLPFYLRIQNPIWLVQSGDKRDVMGSYYIAEKRPAPAPGRGPVLFTFEQFAQQWNKGEQTLRVLVREKNLPQLSATIGAVPTQVLKMGNYVLVSNR